MKARCYWPRHKAFPNYGGRGIIVCERWRKSFEAFFEDMGHCPDGHEIDRRDPNGNYDSDNCRWATPIEQANNMRSNRYVEHDGQRMTVAEFSRKTGIASYTVRRRLDAGLSPAEILKKHVVEHQ